MELLSKEQIIKRCSKFVDQFRWANEMEGEFDYYDIYALKSRYVKMQSYFNAARVRDLEKRLYHEEFEMCQYLHSHNRKKITSSGMIVNEIIK